MSRLRALLLLPLLFAPAASGRRVPAAYVALGDSYAAGPGIPDQQGGLCTRSTRNYARLVAEALGVDVVDRSCMGATTRALHRRQYPNVRPQLYDLGSETRIVTLSIGGNDIGFVEIVAFCTWIAQGGTHCTEHYVEDGVNVLEERLAQAAVDVGEALDAIHARAPNATVFLVGYPRVLPEDDECSWVLPIARGDFPFLRGLVQDLNAMLEREAAEHGAVWVDTFDGSEGHDACAGPMHRWVEPTVTVGYAPLHRNPAGMRYAADRLLEAIREAGVKP